ncbi:MAG: type II toxin-antitoxin system HicB family antitoxin [Planctomycetaceae bacterium]|nr:type II toxin-antitoxin system HicB family antitoxin [Planctomycetaceae bacterium]
MNPLRIPMQVVFYRDDGQWVAHCLQFDLAGVGDTKADAIALLSEAIDIQIRESLKSGNPRNLFSPADSELFQMFAAGQDVAESELRVAIAPHPDIVIERTEAREYLRPLRQPLNRSGLVPA